MTHADTLLRRGLLPLLVVTLAASRACAEHAYINLQVIGPDGQQEASADEEPPAGGVNPRPRMVVKAGDPLVLQFLLTNAYPHGLVKGVTVRYFVVRTGQFGVEQPPDLTDDAIVRGMVKMNFKPKCRAGARLSLEIDEPGIYLVRVETLNTKSDHEHFSAIDLDVK